MNTASSLKAIFPSVRAEVLSAVLLEPERWWFLSQLARHVDVGPSSLQRELKSLVDAGILERRRDGGRVYFRANAGSPIFRDLRGLIEKTAGIVPALAQTTARLGKSIEIALIYGSVARGEERVSSDVDLMIIGSVKQLDLVLALRKLEDRFGREVNATLYSPKEFRQKLAGGDHFLNSVLKGRTILLKGSLDELGKTTAKRKGSPPSDRHSGAGRNSPSRGPRSY